MGYNRQHVVGLDFVVFALEDLVVVELLEEVMAVVGMVRLHQLEVEVYDIVVKTMINIMTIACSRYAEKDLSIDESMVLWHGRLLFRQYIKNKCHKYGIKLYELCEPRGTVLKIQVYSGVHLTDDNGYGQAAATVLDLLDGYLDKGHVVYTDNYYNSVSLVKKMTNRSTYLCGTLRFDRKENPKDLIK
ncbi:piggyBac transposable element-derived protein 4-like [Gigantopelta aegis]|uniref:piggyBac transposable element-derived protein 4-like n=1 Tax=Gigantopelta aegis TaxID=1735272 RepID=UPI001B88C50D|nr:piggyBac transposable element-derived protein 4-like [Gigantopelta aegis]